MSTEAPDLDDLQDIDNLHELELDAIQNLDFERAREILQQTVSTTDESALKEEAHYHNQAIRLSEENHAAYEEELSGITESFQDSSIFCTNAAQENCRRLVARHRAEADSLAQRWREARTLELSRNVEIATSQLDTARTLAIAHAFDEAVKLRDAAYQLRNNEKAESVKAVDRDFVGRWRDMTNRHAQDYQLLHKHLNSHILTLKDKAEFQRQAAEATMKVEEAFSTTLIIDKVCEKSVSPAAREKVIQAYSPRSKASPRSRFSPRSRSSRASEPAPSSDV
jgi:hypothetical protein